LDAIQLKVNQELTSFSQEVDLHETDDQDKRLTRSQQQTKVSETLALESEVVSKKRMLRSWKDLQRDLSDLNDTIKRFSSLVWVSIAVLMT